MASEKMNDIFGPDCHQHNKTMFHLISELGAYDILERIWEYVEENEFQSILKVKNSSGETCLHTAAKCLKGSNAVDMLEMLIDMGADPNDQESDTGNTLLHIAVIKRDYELAAWLACMLSVDMDITNNAGLTPNNLAMIYNDQRMQSLLFTIEIQRDNEINEMTELLREEIHQGNEVH